MAKNKSVDCFKVFFVLVVGFLFAVVQCLYIVSLFRYELSTQMQTLIGIIMGTLTLLNAFLQYIAIDFIESKFKLN